TVWHGGQVPTRVQSQLAEALHLPSDKVRVITPDTGGGFGGKHSGECAIEAALMAKAVGQPVSLRWTREEEFTWAYFRPSGVIEVAGAIGSDGSITAWDFTTINPGGSGVESPYTAQNAASRAIDTNPPLKQGAYRALGSSANHFARESFMDELALAAGIDPLDFRLKHLSNDRMRAVLVETAKRFGWEGRKRDATPGVGFGLAVGTEKGSYVATCAEVSVDREKGVIRVHRLTEVFECGAICDPDNLMAQVKGGMVMGLGGALTESVEFANGKMLNPNLYDYVVPRFADVPELDVHLLNRPDLPSVGGGETPIIAVAPAIANAVYDAIGVRVRMMPLNKGLNA
ncbi:MAG: molybdopterin-dependent oxidoreductase, partial [Candidatus Poribacteria bacterium]|nr:molybdopterin-dependent oxidoreductase [Candidatus Poribacteria bacterium]